MAEKVIVEIEVDEKGAIQDIEGFDDAIQSAEQSLDNLTMGAVTFGKSSVRAIKSAITSFGALKTAIAATGIGALVLAVGSLVTLFTQTERGANKLRVIFAQLGAVLDVVKDALIDVGDGIISLTETESDVDSWFKTAADGAKSFLDVIIEVNPLLRRFRDAVSEAGEVAREYEEALIAIEKQERTLNEERAESIKNIELLKSIGEDITKDLGTRIDALQEAADIEEELLQKEINLESQRLQAVQNSAAFRRGETKALNEFSESIVRLNELEAESAGRAREVQNRLNDLRQQRVAGSAEELESIRMLRADALDNEIQAELDAGQRRLAIRKGINEEILKNNQELIDKSIALRKAEQDFAIRATAGLFKALSGLAEENLATSKALAIAGVIIDSAAAVPAIIRGWSSLGPFGIAGQVAQLATLAASTVTSIRQITNASLGGGSQGFQGGLGPSAPSVGQAINLVAPNQQFDALGQSITNGINGGIGRAYVVGSDITGAQQLDREIARNGQFG